MESRQADKLMNEAIKRILLDVVIRGHGDRLIGRWSREPELQQFLEQVPYMLDRINQLHLACSRVEMNEIEHNHHHHHHRHQCKNELPASNLNHLVNLIGNDRHWLVRTRDTLGLTPLHKAVLFDNRPIVEYIIDRYPEEMAALSWKGQRQQSSKQQVKPGTRIIDAQDKYGRTALHYAAGLLGQVKDKDHHHQLNKQQLYHLLIVRGASISIQDFRGKSAAYYVRHPNELKAKSILHLANKLNANYQANVLTKTLRASSDRQDGQIQELSSPSPTKAGQMADDKIGLHSASELTGLLVNNTSKNMDSMSLSCTDLAKQESELIRSEINSKTNDFGFIKRSKSNLMDLENKSIQVKTTDSILHNKHHGMRKSTEFEPELSILSLTSDEQQQQQQQLENSTGSGSTDYKASLKQLVSERGRQVIDLGTKERIKRSLQEGVMDKINQLIVDGYGSYILNEAQVYCWNLHCKRYIRNVLPKLLIQLDALHESIATNQLLAMKSLLNQDPILARMRRPYKRAALAALHLAVQLDRRLLVAFLLDRFPELLTQRDSSGATCLHLAAKSLKLERLYNWLSENFASQLEQIPDNKNKKASDYRQQAIRAASFEFDSPKMAAQADQALEVSDILHKSQLASNKLELKGTKIEMKRRQTTMMMTMTKSSHNNKRHVENKSHLSNSENETIQKLTTKMVDNPQTDKLETESKGEEESKEEEEEYREIQDSIDSLPIKQRKDSNPMETLERSTANNCELESKEKSPTSDASGASSEETARADNIAGDLAHLVSINDDDDEAEEAEEEQADNLEADKNTMGHNSELESPLPTPSLPFSRPHSASSSSRLETIILEAILSCDYKKLEHLILAGCGERMARIYSSIKKQLFNVVEDNNNQENKRAEMQNFFDLTLKEYLQTIENIHCLLHKCYSETNNIQLDVNRNFYKFCTMLNRKRLIMCRDTSGACPLHVALLRADKRLVEYLLRRHPESASAPDHQLRNALHYSALVFAAYQHHGSFKLTTTTTNGETVAGFWLIDENCKQIYNKLNERYRDLANVKDKNNFTPNDYLTCPSTSSTKHINLNNQTESLLPASILGSCCLEYSKLLERYNYMIIIDNFNVNKSEENIINEVIDGTAELQPNVVLADYEKDDLLEINCTAEDSNQIKKENNSRSFDLSENSLERTDKESGYKKEVRCEQVKKSVNLKSRTNSLKQTRSSDNLLKHLDRELPPNLDIDIPTVARQMAPKPTVGSELGYPMSQIKLEPSIQRSISSATSSSKRQEQKQNNLILNQKMLEPVKISNVHHSHHHKFHHVHSRRRPSTAATQSIVGGVIVPTIIHNDKMDEIETYDIIYRQPPASSSPVNQMSSSSSSISSCSSQSDGSASDNSLLSIGDSPDGIQQHKRSHKRHHQHHHHHHCHRRRRRRRRNNHDDQSSNVMGSESGGIKERNSESGSESSSSDSSELRDDDERAERLSNEFESRVRREKSELKAKVDHIMEEIKISAKSGKSSRFLSTPLGDENNKNGHNEGPSVMFLLDDDMKNRTNSPLAKSLSSSGHSSASGSSRSSWNTNTATTCSSSASSCSSVSSPNTTKINQDIKFENFSMKIDKTETKTAETRKEKMDLSSIAQPLPLVSKNTYGQTYLHFIASRAQSPNTLYKVLNHGSHLIGERDIFYRTARDVALQFNLANNVQVLDKFIIDLFIGSNVKLLWELLKQGYSPLIHVSDSDGNDVMLILKLLKLERAIHFLLQMADFQRWRDELHTFIRHGYLAGVSELVAKHRDLIKAKSAYSRSSLHLAVLFERLEMVHELLEREPTSVHCTDNMGRTPLHYTYGLSNSDNMEEIRQKLLYAGASIDVRDVKMRTPKYYYIFKREIEDIKRIEMELN